jgi:hypothetical protein
VFFLSGLSEYTIGAPQKSMIINASGRNRGVELFSRWK